MAEEARKLDEEARKKLIDHIVKLKLMVIEQIPETAADFHAGGDVGKIGTKQAMIERIEHLATLADTA